MTIVEIAIILRPSIVGVANMFTIMVVEQILSPTSGTTCIVVRLMGFGQKRSD